MPFLWLAILPVALWRTVLQIVRKQPGLVVPEWGAAIAAMVRLPSVARSRSRIRSSRTASWAQIAPLRVSQRALREQLDDDADSAAPARRGDLRFFTGGGAWLVLGALVASFAAFPSLAAWAVLGGGGLQPLAAHVVAAVGGCGLRPPRHRDSTRSGPADPFVGGARRARKPLAARALARAGHPLARSRCPWLRSAGGSPPRA